MLSVPKTTGPVSCASPPSLVRCLAATYVLVATGLGFTPASASDDVIEINQVRAEVGGVTPGDGPGFPVTLSLPGSYRLTSNLDVRGVVNPASTTAIQVTSEAVSIDLGGFAILGPVVCTADGNTPNTVTCVPSGGQGHGIEAGGPGSGGLFTNSTRVSNGSIQGMGSTGVYFAFETRDVVAVSNGGAGIVGYTIFSSQAHRNGSIGIYGGLVADSIASYNGSDGVASVLVRDVVANSNGDAGIFAQVVDGSVASGNAYGFSANVLTNSQAYQNSGFGFLSGSSGAYRSNTFIGNNGGGAQTDGGIELGPNVCGGSTTCP